MRSGKKKERDGMRSLSPSLDVIFVNFLGGALTKHLLLGSTFNAISRKALSKKEHGLKTPSHGRSTIEAVYQRSDDKVDWMIYLFARSNPKCCRSSRDECTPGGSSAVRAA